MSERKVLNKYYPPDFDPTKIPKLRLPKNRTFNIRLMAPFNMRCNTCGEYIYKGKKFNSRKETVEDDNYLGLHIYRFYIKCPQCIAEISFRTDPANTDYELEAGATRNFEAMRTAERLALKEQKEKEEEEANNPMKLLENRTKASQREMDSLESLEDLKEMKRRHETLNTEDLLHFHAKKEEEFAKKMDDEEKELEEQIKFRFGGKIKRHSDWFENKSEPLSKAAKSETGSMQSNDVFKKPSSSTDSFKKRYEKIWASVKPKNKPESTVVLAENKPPLQTEVQVVPTASTEILAQVEVSKPAQTEVPKPANSVLKLTEYSDSDED